MCGGSWDEAEHARDNFAKRREVEGKAGFDSARQAGMEAREGEQKKVCRARVASTRMVLRRAGVGGWADVEPGWTLFILMKDRGLRVLEQMM